MHVRGYVCMQMHVSMYVCMKKTMHTYMCVCMFYFDTHVYVYMDAHFMLRMQGGEDAKDASTCRSLSANEPIITGLFCGKRPIQIRHRMPFCHPVVALLTGFGE